MRFAILFILLVSSQIIRSQTKEVSFSLLRQNDDASALWNNDPNRSAYHKFKYIQINNRSSLTLGGGIRLQYEGFLNDGFKDEGENPKSWILNRNMLHAKYSLDERFVLFAELNSSLIYGKQDLSPVDKDALSFNQLFLSYTFNPRWKAIAGRENMRLGSGRLVDFREGPNVRLSFDKVEVVNTYKSIINRYFLAFPVFNRAGVFDNDFLRPSEYLAGFHSTIEGSFGWDYDAYLLYKYEENKNWLDQVVSNTDNRASIGVRQFGLIDHFLFNNEFVFQFGSYGSSNILAWTISFNLEYRFRLGRRSILVGLKTELISGDRDSTDSRLGTFDGLYPRGAYFGRVARFGPSNLIDLHPYISIPIKRFLLEVDYVAFWRFSKEDGIYDPGLNLAIPARNDERFVAHQLGFIFGRGFSKHFSIEVESNLIIPGPFLYSGGETENLLHWVVTTEYRF